jgi:hypothetical protein
MDEINNNNNNNPYTRTFQLLLIPWDLHHSILQSKVKNQYEWSITLLAHWELEMHEINVYL